MPPNIQNFERWLEINQKKQLKDMEKKRIMREHVNKLP